MSDRPVGPVETEPDQHDNGQHESGHADGADLREPGLSMHHSRSVTVAQVSAAVVAILVAVAALSSVFRGWVPVYDNALLELRVRDVPSHLPLLGAWSRFGWSHPGPAHFYFLSVVYWLGARRSEALLVGAITMHLMFGFIAWWTVRRISATAGAFMALGVLVIVVTTTPTVMRDPWNPYVTLVGGMALCGAAWSFAERHREGALTLLPVGTFLAQAHIVTGPFVVAVTAAAIVCLLTGRHRQIPWRAIVAGAGITLAMWLPPIVQQLTNDPGNITLILEKSGSGAKLGPLVAIRVMSRALGLWPDVFTPAAMSVDDMSTLKWFLPVWGLVFCGVAVLVARRRKWDLFRGFVIAAAALVGTTMSIAMISGSPHNYLALSRIPTVAFMVVVSVVAISEERRWPVPKTQNMAYGACVVLALLAVFQQLGAQNPRQDARPTVEAFVAAVQRADVPAEVGVELTSTHVFAGEIYFALLNTMEKDGFQPNAESLKAIHVGAHRKERPVRYMLRLAPLESEGGLIDDGWTVIAEHQPFSAGEVARIRSADNDRDADLIRRGRTGLVLVGRPVD
ncbi:MAG: hypothetical protein KDB26_02915 [Microthrixaceae bacterium]|nr:hypothetical protein [Microthrixaceae bacterium]